MPLNLNPAESALVEYFTAIDDRDQPSSQSVHIDMDKCLERLFDGVLPRHIVLGSKAIQDVERAAVACAFGYLEQSALFGLPVAIPSIIVQSGSLPSELLEWGGVRWVANPDCGARVGDTTFVDGVLNPYTNNVRAKIAAAMYLARNHGAPPVDPMAIAHLWPEPMGIAAKFEIERRRDLRNTLVYAHLKWTRTWCTKITKTVWFPGCYWIVAVRQWIESVKYDAVHGDRHLNDEQDAYADSANIAEQTLRAAYSAAFNTKSVAERATEIKDLGAKFIRAVEEVESTAAAARKAKRDRQDVADLLDRCAVMWRDDLIKDQLYLEEIRRSIQRDAIYPPAAVAAETVTAVETVVETPAATAAAVETAVETPAAVAATVETAATVAVTVETAVETPAAVAATVETTVAVTVETAVETPAAVAAHCQPDYIEALSDIKAKLVRLIEMLASQ